MYNQGDIDDPTRKEPREKRREPKDEPRGTNDQHAPEHGEVIELYPIGPPVELRLGSAAKEPLVMSHQVTPILERGHHRVRPKCRLPESLQTELAGLGIPDLRSAAPHFACQGGHVQPEI